MVFDPFSQVPAEQQQVQVIEKTVPQPKEYILGIEAGTFFGIFMGILAALIFISLVSYLED